MMSIMKYGIPKSNNFNEFIFVNASPNKVFFQMTLQIFIQLS